MALCVLRTINDWKDGAITKPLGRLNCSFAIVRWVSLVAFLQSQRWDGDYVKHDRLGAHNRCIFGSVSTVNTLPEHRDKGAMDKLLEEELLSQVLWEEKSLPQDAESIMDALILHTNFTPKSISKIHYSVSGPGERKAKGAPFFHPTGPGTGRVWQLDKRNVRPRLLASSRQRKQRGQKIQPCAQTSKAALATDTEVDSESSFTLPKTDKSFSAKGYDNKNPNKKCQRASATLEGKWTLLFNAVQAAMHAMSYNFMPCVHRFEPCASFEDLNTLTLKHTNTLGYGPMMHICNPICKGFIHRIHCRLLLTPCKEPLLSYFLKSELLRSFCDFCQGRYVPHGDLSLNNFIIHDEQGYYMDFDHAGITEGSKCIHSQGMIIQSNHTGVVSFNPSSKKWISELPLDLPDEIPVLMASLSRLTHPPSNI
ncbi:hypothetical protein EV702DRAFT_1044904 [Suillus placidus]|uniref:Uncharacterized protein n=1 Tax=Suillus placidus TaxID=48579 RepID=A0A9P7D2J0_9AGAM|nr:hypothetical protein EV702DRAFT_1044904 [Suillus placidus]